jgi:hypothetical protein
MSIRPTLIAGLACGLALVPASSQDPRGRKYKAPPETSHIEVLVLKDNNQKPIPNAAVVFHAVKDGKDEGNLEVKTNEDGKAIIDVIATGSNVDVQVIADGFATFANTYLVAEPSRNIEIRMIRPRAQISTYVDNRGKEAQRPAGIQEPPKPAGINEKTPPSATVPSGTPLQTNPPNMHPDNQYPVDPATPARNQNPPPTTPPTTPPQP